MRFSPEAGRGRASLSKGHWHKCPLRKEKSPLCSPRVSQDQNSQQQNPRPDLEFTSSKKVNNLHSKNSFSPAMAVGGETIFIFQISDAGGSY